MPAHRRALIIGLATGGVLAGLGALGWALAGMVEFLAFFGLWGGLTACVTLVLARLLRRLPEDGDEGGGGGPGDPPPDDDPPWWPGFERALRAYERDARTPV